MTEEPVASAARVASAQRGGAAGYVGGALIGVLGGLIGLGGAEFRLPLLIGVFRFGALQAVILNKAMSLVVVASALPFRAATVPFSAVAAHWPIIVNLLAGSLLGAWFGAGWATRLASQTLYRVISVLLVCIALILAVGHGVSTSGALLTGPAQTVVGVAAGLVIGVIAALLGVAGGELLIPTLILLFGVDIKLAGSLSLAVSLPTMLVGFVHSVQSGPELHCPQREPPLRSHDGRRLHRGEFRRRTVAWAGSQLHPAACPRDHSGAVGPQGLAS
jgi:uncharacterized membrane protein YfcA